MFEVGKVYLWNNGNIYPCFVSWDNMEDREIAKDGFIMRCGSRESEYVRGIVSPTYKSKCTCVSISPLTFDVEGIESSIVENVIDIQQRHVVSRVMVGIGRPVSELESYVLKDNIIPFVYENKAIDEATVKHELIRFLTESVGKGYSGDPQLYSSYMDRMRVLLTAVFGCRIASALIKLNDTGNVRVEFADNRFKAFYSDEEFNDFLMRVEGVVKEPVSPMQGFINAAGSMQG